MLNWQGPRHKAGAHILDLAAPPNAAAPAAGVPDPALAASVVDTIAAVGAIDSSNGRSIASVLDEQGSSSSGAADPALADSAPDIDAAAADAGTHMHAQDKGALLSNGKVLEHLLLRLTTNTCY